MAGKKIPLFLPISRQAALTDLADLPKRLAAGTQIRRSGTEGRHLRAMAQLQQRWLHLFYTLNRRANP